MGRVARRAYDTLADTYVYQVTHDGVEEDVWLPEDQLNRKKTNDWPYKSKRKRYHEEAPPDWEPEWWRGMSQKSARDAKPKMSTNSVMINLAPKKLQVYAAADSDSDNELPARRRDYKRAKRQDDCPADASTDSSETDNDGQGGTAGRGFRGRWVFPDDVDYWHMQYLPSLHVRRENSEEEREEKCMITSRRSRSLQSDASAEGAAKSARTKRYEARRIRQREGKQGVLRPKEPEEWTGESEDLLEQL